MLLVRSTDNYGEWQCSVHYDLFIYNNSTFDSYMYASVGEALEAYSSRRVCPSVCLCVILQSTFFATATN